MFSDENGKLSSTKIYTFFGYFTFLAVSIYVLYSAPDKFDYMTFAILSGGLAVPSRILDKVLNIYSGKLKDDTSARKEELENERRCCNINK